MRSALRAVNDDQRISLPPHHFCDLTHRIDGAQRVRNVAERDDTRPMSQHRSQSVEIDSPVTCQLADAETRAALDRQLLPGDEVRVMLERGDHYVVAGQIGRASGRE